VYKMGFYKDQDNPRVMTAKCEGLTIHFPLKDFNEGIYLVTTMFEEIRKERNIE